jgi:hypothetical protein
MQKNFILRDLYNEVQRDNYDFQTICYLKGITAPSNPVNIFLQTQQKAGNFSCHSNPDQ